MSVQVFTLPDLGEGLTEAELVRWLVGVGDTVEIDAPVAEVETAKATVEVPSPFGGTIAELHGEEGTTLTVGAPLISVSSGEAIAGSGDAAATYVEQERAGSGNVLIGYGTSEAAPSRRRRRGAAATGAPTPAESPAQPPTPSQAAPATTDTSPGGPSAGPKRAAPSTADTPPPRSGPSRNGSARSAVVSPIVRRLARRTGVDLVTLAGSGPDGLILRRDVEEAAAAAVTATSDATAPAGTGATAATDAQRAGAPGDRALSIRSDVDGRTSLPIGARIPLRGMRKAVAETLTRSRAEIPEATTWVDADATALLELREELAASGNAPGILAILGRFVVAGLARFPELNARVDTDRAEIARLDGVNLGIAAQTDRGLVVPAVRDAHRLGMRGLDTEIRRLTAAARESTATAAELGSGSFTLNNHGVLGVDGSAAIINHPEVAILGMGRILPRPWVVVGEIVVRHVVQLSLVFDHRVCDGGTAGGFLRFVADAVENPTSAMAEL